MKVYVLGPNLSDQSKGNLIAHRDDCGEIQRDERRNPGAFGDVTDARSRIEVAAFVYPPGEFDWDGSVEESGPYVGDIWFAPCLKDLPAA